MPGSESHTYRSTPDLPDTRLNYVPLIAKGAGIVFGGSIIGFGLRYLFQAIVARHIGAEMFGLFSLSIAIFSMGDVIASLGMDKGVVRFVALYERDRDYRRVKGTINAAALAVLLAGAVTALLLMTLSNPLATTVFHVPQLAAILRLFAIAIPFSAMTTVLLSATQGLRIMKYKVYVRDLFEQLFRVAISVSLFLLGWRLKAATSTYVLSLVCGTLLSYHYFRGVFRPTFTPDVHPIVEHQRLLRYCWPLLFANILFVTEAWLSMFIAGYFLAAKDVGVFAAAYRTSLLVQAILMSFNTMFSPIIANLHHKGEHEQLQSLFKVVAKWIFSLSFPFILLMILFPKEILSIFGQDFLEGSIALVVLSCGQLMNSVSGPLGAMIVMSGKSRISLCNAIAHFLLQAVLCFFLIPKYGVFGAALAKTISIAFLRIILLLEVRYFLRMHPFRGDLIKPVLAGILALGVWSGVDVFMTQIHHPLLSLVAGAAMLTATYGIVLRALGISDEDREILQKIKEKFSRRGA